MLQQSGVNQYAFACDGDPMDMGDHFMLPLSGVPAGVRPTRARADRSVGGGHQPQERRVDGLQGPQGPEGVQGPPGEPGPQGEVGPRPPG